MKRLSAAVLALCLLFTVFGCSGMSKKLDAGVFTVDMPGEPVKSTEQLPLNLLGIGLDGALIVTALQSTDKDGAEYIALSVGWSDTLKQMQALEREAWSNEKFTQAVVKNIEELMMQDAHIQDQMQVNVNGQDAHVAGFVITEELDLGQQRVTQGEYVTILNDQYLVMVIYAAEQSVFSERDKNNFLYSVTINE
ncbi:MAG: hypothetical protein IJP30_02085 [Clostridia bacterium]|nr:hypothetical protein [Clostridia bacterium]